MSKQREDGNLQDLIGRVMLSIVSAIGGALANIVVAPLAPPLENLEIQVWFWLVQDREKHLWWGWIILYISLVLAGIIALLVFFVLAHLEGAFSSSRKRGYFAEDWRRQLNPHAWHQQRGQQKPPPSHPSNTP